MSRASLAERYWPLVPRIARSILAKIPPSPGAELGDLEGHGAIALVEAEASWNPASGIRFPAYAYVAINAAIIDGLRKSKPLGWRIASKHRELVRTRAMLEQLLGRTPTPIETAEALGVTHQDLAELERAYAQGISSVSLDARVNDADPLTETLGSDENNPASLYEHAESIADVRRRVANLSERDRLIVALYYGEELTHIEVGARLGVSLQRAYQLREAVLVRLRDDTLTEGS